MGVKFLQVQTKGETRSGDSRLKGGKESKKIVLEIVRLVQNLDSS